MRYRPSSTVAAETIDDEAIVIDLQSGAYYCFRDWTAWAWNVLSGGIEPAEIEQFFGDVGGVSAFVEQLTQAGMLVERGDLAPLELPPHPDATPEPLAIERFDDMADMIQLDPVHDVGRDEGWPRAADA